VIPLALETYQVLLDLARFAESGVSIIESRQFLRTGEIEIPDWGYSAGREAALISNNRPAAGFGTAHSAVVTASKVVSPFLSL
jgi:hypothetical protein